MVLPKSFVEVRPDFLHPSIQSEWNLHRYDNLDSRFYFEFDEEANRYCYISVTSLAQRVIPMGANFHQWLMDTGKSAMREKDEKAVFGSLFHREAMKPIHGKDEIHGRGYNFGFLDEIAPGHFYIDEDGRRQQCTQFHMMVSPEWRWKASSWLYSFKRGLLAWFYFVSTSVSNIVAVEYPARSKEKNVACTIDMVASVQFYGKARASIVDIKSFLFSEVDDKRKSFFDPHSFQLEVSKDIWNEAHGDFFPVTHIFNWSPKAWKKDPSDWSDKYKPYTLKNQTDNKYSLEKTFLGSKMKASDILIAYGNVMGMMNPPTKVSDISGSFEDIQTFEPSDHVKTFDLFNQKISTDG